MICTTVSIIFIRCYGLFFFFSSRRRHTRSVSAFLLNRSSDLVGALRLSPLRRGLAIDSTVDIFTFYVPHRHVYGEQWIKFMKDGVNATPLPTVNTTGYIDHAAFLGTKSGMVNITSSVNSRERSGRSEERFSRNAETELVCRLLLEKKKVHNVYAKHLK